MNKLEELNELRNKAGIVFQKSFNCQDAEKNIHLCDKDKFFSKIVKRLEEMGYVPCEDFTFEVVRYKFPYAERHHIMQSYEWKYFYSTTFEITQDLLQYLLRHNFIKEKVVNNKKLEKTDDEKLLSWETLIEKNNKKIKEFKEIVKEHIKLGNKETVDNYTKAITTCRQKIKNLKEKINNLEGNKNIENE